MTEDSKANILRHGTLALVVINLMLNVLTLQNVTNNRMIAASVDAYLKKAASDRFTGTQAKEELSKRDEQIMLLRERLDEIEEVKR